MDAQEVKKLRRAALEPARVFARRDFDPNDSRPVFHYSWGTGTQHRDFYSPHFPTWIFEGNDELHVIEKAIDRYGLEEAPVTGKWWDYAEFLFDPERGTNFESTQAEYRTMTNGAIVPFFHVGGIDFMAATPAVYAQRRFGPFFVRFTKEGKFIRVLFENRVVGVIRCQDGSYLTEMETA